MEVNSREVFYEIPFILLLVCYFNEWIEDWLLEFYFLFLLNK